MVSKQADLAGPGIGSYEELEKVLPQDYNTLLSPKDTQQAITIVKRYIEDNLCRQLNLMRVEVPLIVDVESGVNDYLDRDGSRTPIEFHISNDHDKHPVDAQVVQAATKWKRVALKQFGMKPGEGLSQTCAQCARITSWIMTIALTWTSGIGRNPLEPTSVT
jgi:aspartate--ammonia ligase